MGQALFWDFVQRRMAVPCRRFRTTYPSRLQGSSSPRLTLDHWRWDRQVIPKRRYGTTILRYV